MSLYKGSQKIQDTGAYGIFINNKPIDRIYKGSEKIYQYHPYTPGKVLFFKTGAAEETIKVPFGVYRIACTGGGGNTYYWAYNSAFWAVGGGSGATWEGDIYFPSEATIKLHAGGALQPSYIEINGTRVITAGNGGDGGFTVVGPGGTLSTALSNFTVVNTIVSKNGNAGGGTTLGTSQTGGASTSSYKFGGGTVLQGGAVQAGGCRLEFLRRKP